MGDLIDRQAMIDALHTRFLDGFDGDKWWNSTHVLAAIEGLPSVQEEHKWETCFDCPLSHGCPKIKGCTNEQAMEYASQIPNDCPLSVQPECKTDVDTISRQAAIDALDDIRYTDRQDWWAVLSTVENLPPARPKRGKWVKKEHLVPLARDAEPLDWDKYDEKTHSELQEYWHCSECDYEGDRHFRPSWKYCPNCGIEMETKNRK